MVDDQTAELHDEIIILVNPYFVVDMSGKRAVVFPVYLAAVYLRMILFFVPCRSVLQVDQDRSRVGLFVSVSVQCRMGSGCQFCFYLCLVECDSIISRSGIFGGLTETATVSIPCAVAFTSERHHEDISQIHTSGSIQMSLCEPPDNGVGIHVFGAISPSHSSCYRTGLYHTERTAGSRKGMSVVGCSDERINVLCIICLWSILLGCTATVKRASQCKSIEKYRKFFHESG